MKRGEKQRIPAEPVRHPIENWDVETVRLEIGPRVHVSVEVPDAGIRAVVTLARGTLYGRDYLFVRNVSLRASAEGPIDVAKWRAFPLRRVEDVVNLPHIREELLGRGLDPNKPVNLDLDEPLYREPPPSLPPRPEHGMYPDEFYRAVADHYRYHVGRDEKPAKTMAAVFDTPVRTVHGWIAEARRRGHLEPASRQGRTG